MFTNGSKLFFGYAAFAAVAAIAYALGSGDRMGIVLFLGVLFSSAFVGLFLVGRPVPVVAGAPAAAQVTAQSRLPRPSVWPATAGIGATVFLVGVSVDAPLLTLGAIATALAGAGWFIDVWTTARGRTTPGALEAQERVGFPTQLPVLAILGIGLLVVSFSRILLAVPKDASTTIALVAAGGILIVSFVIASRHQLSGGVLAGLAAFLGIAVLAGGVVAAANGTRKIEPEGGKTAVAEVAKGVAFTEKTLTVNGEGAIVVHFRNEDAEQIHNMAFFTDSSAKKLIYFGDAVNGLGERNYVFKTPGPGEYFYRCEFHTGQMTGKLVVEAPPAEKEKNRG